MIFTALIYIISVLFNMVALALPAFQILPQIVFTSIDFFFTKLMELNSIFYFIDNVLIVGLFFLKFLAYFLLYKLFVMTLNYFRGAGGLK